MQHYPNEGHRKRLRDRFLKNGFEGFHDYEIIELILTLGTPRKDCKQVAKNIIKNFGGLKSSLEAQYVDLKKIKGVGPSNAIGIRLFQELLLQYSKDKLPKKITFDSSKIVADYLIRYIGQRNKEYFVMLLLDSRLNLIKIVDVSVGTLNQNLVHPREVFKEAIQNSAACIIVAHNHPSNDIEPSPEDVALTRRLEEASKILGIKLLDHLIITKDSHSSMKELKLL